MLTTTKGIVFHQIKYSETSVIAKIYTESFGLKSYLIKGARSRKSRISQGLLQHMSLIEFVTNHRENKNLQHLREMRSAHQYNSIPFNIVKSSICIFVNELCYKSIQEEEANSKLFEYIFNAMQWFDLSEENYVNFHLVFGIRMSSYLGFYPRGTYSSATPFFDFEEGRFISNKPMHLNYSEGLKAQNFSRLTTHSFDNIATLKLNAQQRNQLLDDLIKYYQLHLPSLGKLKSPEILRTVLN